jgi:hypothetical protein
MSTHSTLLWLRIRERDGGEASIDVADDIGVDCCVRLSLSEGVQSGPQVEAEIHLNVDQAELVAQAILAAAQNQRRRNSDPAWAATTLEQGKYFP